VHRPHRQPFAERAAARATGLAPGTMPAPVLRLLGPDPAPGPTARPARWGLVLGGGGVLGAAWLIGALAAVERSRGLDARDAQLIVGTSAGSVVGGLLAAGVGVPDLLAHQSGRPLTDGPLAGLTLDTEQAAGPALPPRPALRLGSPGMLRNNRGHLRDLPPTTLLAGLMPPGRGTMTGVRELIEAVVPAGEWTGHPGFRAVAVDYDTGRRVAFGAPDAPSAGLSEAVLASCAIPSWYRPVQIGGHRYVDGGVWSATNADLLAGAGLEEVIVLAPMASLHYDTPADWLSRLERTVRISVTRRCLAEARQLNAEGCTVTVLGPGPADLAALGHNPMAPGRRRSVLATSLRSGLQALGGPGDLDLRRPLMDLENIEDALRPPDRLRDHPPRSA
jgi:NTE family protein